MIAYARPVDRPSAGWPSCSSARRPDRRPLWSLRRLRRRLVLRGHPCGAGEAASAPLDRPGVELAPRAQWPTGADRLGVHVKGKITPASSSSPAEPWPG